MHRSADWTDSNLHYRETVRQRGWTAAGRGRNLATALTGQEQNYVHGLTNKSVVLVAVLLRHRDRHTLTAPPTPRRLSSPCSLPPPPSTPPRVRLVTTTQGIRKQRELTARDRRRTRNKGKHQQTPTVIWHVSKYKSKHGA